MSQCWYWVARWWLWYRASFELGDAVGVGLEGGGGVGEGGLGVVALGA